MAHSWERELFTGDLPGTRRVGMPIGLPAPRWLLEPALWALRNESELVLKSRWVLPDRLTSAGFEFRWPQLGPALEDTVGSRPRSANSAPGPRSRRP